MELGTTHQPPHFISGAIELELWSNFQKIKLWRRSFCHINNLITHSPPYSSLCHGQLWECSKLEYSVRSLKSNFNQFFDRMSEAKGLYRVIFFKNSRDISPVSPTFCISGWGPCAFCQCMHMWFICPGAATNTSIEMSRVLVAFWKVAQWLSWGSDLKV